MSRQILGFTVALLMAAALLAPAGARAGDDDDKRGRAIHAVIPNRETGLLVILGRGLTRGSRPPKVFLGGRALAGESATGTVVTAVLPDPIEPGSYPLSLGGSGDSKRRVDVAIPDAVRIAALQADPAAASAIIGANAINIASNTSAISANGGKIASNATAVAAIGPHILITGASLHVRGGSGDTDGAVNGLGNLIVGYNEAFGAGNRGGSHNLVIGESHRYRGFGGLVAERNNVLAGATASVSGGLQTVVGGNFQWRAGKKRDFALDHVGTFFAHQ